MKNFNAKVSCFAPLTLVFIFAIACLALLSSCVATVRTPRHVRSTIIIEDQNRGDHLDHQDRHHY